MQDIHTWGDVRTLFAMPGARFVLVVVVLLFVVSGTFSAAAKFAKTLSERAHDVRADEMARNPEFEAPDPHQMRWHVTHTRDDVSQITLFMGSIYVTLQVILAVLIIDALMAAL